MRNRRDTKWRWLLAGVVILAAAGSTDADDSPNPGLPTAKQDGGFSLPKPSLESVIAWTDQHFFHQYRIQAHVESNQCRLLDGDNETRAEGTFDECLAQLNSIKREQNLPPMRGKAVVLLHGLAAPRWSMGLLASHLARNGGYQTFSIDYASLRTNMDNHASSLANVLRSLQGIEEINLVGHSMGNIVIRRYLAGNNTAPHAWKPDPRIKRIVMIAPPNHGSITASRLSNTSAFKAVFGKSGRQLGVEWSELEKQLAIPNVEFGILAGGFSNSIGLNPFLPGDDDGRITVKTTRLAGATDFAVVPAIHELIANDPRVFEFTLKFLESGYFISQAERQSIPIESIAERPGTKIR